MGCRTRVAECRKRTTGLTRRVSQIGNRRPICLLIIKKSNAVGRILGNVASFSGMHFNIVPANSKGSFNEGLGLPGAPGRDLERVYTYVEGSRENRTLCEVSLKRMD